MFGSHKNDDLANTEDNPEDTGGFVSTPHPEPTGAPEPPTTDASADTPASDLPQFGQPFTPGSVLPSSDTSATTVTTDSPTSEPPQSEAAPSLPTPGNEDLINIKKEALQKLTPLVGHLDQTPEEKFKTTMMMIQASDDQSLIQKAYEAADQISDDKVKAQALLDIVNEINYFTQNNQ